MQVKIGDYIFDTNIEPIMIFLSNAEKKQIADSGDGSSVLIEHPEGYNAQSINEFVHFKDRREPLRNAYTEGVANTIDAIKQYMYGCLATDLQDNADFVINRLARTPNLFYDSVQDMMEAKKDKGSDKATGYEYKDKDGNVVAVELEEIHYKCIRCGKPTKDCECITCAHCGEFDDECICDEPFEEEDHSAED